MDKYYTPEIEEFHVGFEFEYNDPDTQSSFEKQIFNWQWADIVYDDHEHELENFHQLYRVKYLDEEDIENLGFIKSKAFLQHGIKTYELEDIRLYYHSTVNSNFKFIELIKKKSSYIITGIIKNKSEFKKLLKQINISYAK
jgi:hypothetical protein